MEKQQEKNYNALPILKFKKAGSAFFAYQRYRQGADSAFATAYETGMGGPGGITSPGSGSLC